MENMTNIFMQQVRDAMNFSIFHPFKYLRYSKKRKEFKKRILTGSPSFGVLWYFAEFIKFCEIIFFYDNSTTNGVYSSNKYDLCTNGFRINYPDAIITIKLYSDSQTVSMDIENRAGNKIKTNYVFENNGWTKEPDAYDILHIDNIINIINRTMIRFMDRMIDIRLGKDDIY